MSEKPFKGSLVNWDRYYYGPDKYIITGKFIGHPEFNDLTGHTSQVLSERKNEDGSVDVETRNSRYKLV